MSEKEIKHLKTLKNTQDESETPESNQDNEESRDENLETRIIDSDEQKTKENDSEIKITEISNNPWQSFFNPESDPDNSQKNTIFQSHKPSSIFLTDSSESKTRQQRQSQTLEDTAMFSQLSSEKNKSENKQTNYNPIDYSDNVYDIEQRKVKENHDMLIKTSSRQEIEKTNMINPFTQRKVDMKIFPELDEIRKQTDMNFNKEYIINPKSGIKEDSRLPFQKKDTDYKP